MSKGFPSQKFTNAKISNSNLLLYKQVNFFQVCSCICQGAVAKKEQYLAEAVADRMQLEVSMKQISDWIHGAEDLLDSGYEGLDYDTLNDTISEHKVRTNIGVLQYG